MPAIEVSCPSCGKETVIEMKHSEPNKGGMVEIFESMITDMGIKKYAFDGEGLCAQCGEKIDVSVIVSTMKSAGTEKMPGLFSFANG